MPAGVGFLTAADFDVDGRLDLAVARYEGSRVSVGMMLNQGSGVFAEARAYAPGKDRGYWGTAAGDFDGDGRPDLVVAGNDDVSVMLNRGDGTFGEPQNVGAGPWIFSVATSDLDGNGKPDITLVSNDMSSRIGMVQVLLNHGGMRFSARAFGVGHSAGLVTTGDFDRDGLPELLVVADQHVGVLRNLGDGDFAPARNYALPSAFPSDVVSFADADTADLDGDGSLDIVVANYTTPHVYVLRNRGDGTFAEPQAVDGSFDSGDFVRLTDLNGDGRPDLVVGGLGDGWWRLFLNGGDGEFLPPQGLFGEPFYGKVVLGDFNSDGKPDLAASTLTGASLLLNQTP